MEVGRFSTLFSFCISTTIFLLITTTSITVHGGLLIKEGGKKSQIILFGKSCAPTVIKTGGKKGKQLILLPGGGGNGQNCGGGGGGYGSQRGYGSGGSLNYGGNSGGNYGGHGMSSSPMTMMMPSSSDMHSQMMANMAMHGMMMSDMAGYGSGDGGMMMPVYSMSGGSGMSGGEGSRNGHGNMRMNSYGGNNGNNRPMHTDSGYKTGRPMMHQSENRNRGQYEMNRGGGDNDDYGSLNGGKNGGYGRDLQNDDDQQHQPTMHHLSILDGMSPEKRKRSWQKKADDEMMEAMASMLVRSRALQPGMAYRPHY